ncbi:hypothetical protein NW759_003107 [Fusarium solani]|nr:hypothetical protein NW759_003107 [Fusarium solani]
MYLGSTYRFPQPHSLQVVENAAARRINRAAAHWPSQSWLHSMVIALSSQSRIHQFSRDLGHHSLPLSLGLSSPCQMLESFGLWKEPPRIGSTTSPAAQRQPHNRGLPLFPSLVDVT